MDNILEGHTLVGGSYAQARTVCKNGYYSGVVLTPDKAVDYAQGEAAAVNGGNGLEARAEGGLVGVGGGWHIHA